jgi:hypothetical protein
MARRRLTEAEPELVKTAPALTRVKAGAVTEHAVDGAVRLLTVDVGVSGDAFDGSAQLVAGAMVRLRPRGLCTDDDLRWAEDRARELGALTVSRMPLPDVAPTTFEDGDAGEPQDDDVPEQRMGDVMRAQLERQMMHEGCDAGEMKETIELAQRMLEAAGG